MKKAIPIVVFLCDPISARLYQNLDKQIGGQIKIFEIGAKAVLAEFTV